MKSITLGCALAGACLMLAAGVAAATTIHVAPDGSGDYPTIQAAINASFSGDEIVLADGVFRGPGNFALDFGGRAIVLRSESEDPLACVIDCEAQGRGIRLHSAEGPTTRIEGLTITRAAAMFGAGMQIMDGASPTIRNCRLIENLASSDGGGISCWTGSAPVIVDCVFEGNQAGEAFGGALECESDAVVTVEGCLVRGNRAGYGGGLAVWAGAQVSLSGCTLVENASASTGGAILCVSDTKLTLDHCTLVGNTTGGNGFCLASPTTGEMSYISVQRSILAFNESPAVGCSPTALYRFSCTDIYGNDGLDWGPCIQDQLGVNGNIEDDPRFCGDAVPDRPYTLRNDSPCAPENAPECGLIGAWPVGCEGAMEVAALDDGALGLRVDPNPSRGGAWLRFRLPTDAGTEGARLDLFEASGRAVRGLSLPAGGLPDGGVAWDGRDESGRSVGSGVYFWRLTCQDRSWTRAFVVAR